MLFSFLKLKEKPQKQIKEETIVKSSNPCNAMWIYKTRLKDKVGISKLITQDREWKQDNLKKNGSKRTNGSANLI